MSKVIVFMLAFSHAKFILPYTYVYNLTPEAVEVHVRGNAAGGAPGASLGYTWDGIIQPGKVEQLNYNFAASIVVGNEHSQFWDGDNSGSFKYYIMRKDGRFNRWDAFMCNNPPKNDQGCHKCSGKEKMLCKGQYVVTWVAPTIEGRKEQMADGTFFEGAAYIFKGRVSEGLITKTETNTAISPAYWPASVGELTTR